MAARRGSRVALWAGLAGAAAAVSTPVDAWAANSLTGHMTQHTVLIGIVGPLLALGTRAPARRLAGHRLAAALAAALVVHTILVLGWHAPVLFDAAERTDPLHAVEHVSFVAAAWLLWWVAARAGGPGGWGPGGLAVFISLLPLTVLGVGMLLSGTTWYAHHDDLVDQQIGGVVMWAGGGLLALVGAVALGVAWIAAVSDAETGATGRSPDAADTDPDTDRPTVS